MDLKILEESVQGFTSPDYGRVPRSGASYLATERFVRRGLQLCLGLYRRGDRLDQTSRLLRDSMDFLLRRYHRYAIKEHIQAHYRDRNVRPGEPVDFEHVIPAANLTALLIQGRIPVGLAMNPPTCMLKRENHAQLGRLGLADSTPDIWNFWQRYRDLGLDLETHRGDPVDQNTWNLGTHVQYFNIKL